MTLKQAAQTSYSFKSIQPEVSDQLVTDDLFETDSFLYHSKTICPQLRHEFLEVSKDGKFLGKLYFQIMPFKGSELKSYIPDQESPCFINKTMEALIDLALERVNWSLAVLGNVFITGDNGQYLIKGISDEDRWLMIQEATNHISKQTNIDAFLISDLRSDDLNGKNKLLDKGYRIFEVEPDLIFDIDLNWKSFDDYLGNIVSKYRVRTKKVLEKSQQLEIKDFSAQELKENEQAIYALYKNVVHSASFKLAEIGSNYFFDFKQAYSDIFFVRGFYLDKNLVGVISFFAESDALRINFVGLNYDYNKVHAIYQRILYDCIEQGILLKKESIHFGRTASEIKTSVGAYPVKTFALLKHNNKIPNLAIKPLTTYLKPEPFEIRNPFKVKKAV
jgi:predicted N-acyltransferase